MDKLLRFEATVKFDSVTESECFFFSFSPYEQTKCTPAKLRTTKYVIEDEDLVQSTTCAVM